MIWLLIGLWHLALADALLLAAPRPPRAPQSVIWYPREQRYVRVHR